MEYIDLLLLTLGATLRVATPLMLAALAALYAERSGILDLGLEGKMLAGAFAAAVVTSATGISFLGLIAAMMISCGFAMLHGYACITHKGNQVVSGVAINIVASGLTGLLTVSWFAAGGRTPAIPDEDRLSPIVFPGADALSDVPVLGTFYSGILGGHNILTYLALLLVPATWFVLAKTTFGLRLHSAGENPAAVDTAGVSVARVQYSALVVSGALCGLAGAYLSIGQGAGFIADMTAGKGFIALAAVIFGKWRPAPTMFACLLFGFFDASAARIQGSGLSDLFPGEFIQALPYLFTVLVLALFVGKAVAPKALGKPYMKEQ